MIQDIFMWVGVACSIVALLFFLLFINAFRFVELLWNRAKNTIRRWRNDYYEQGPRGIRYRIGIRLILPYVEARYRRARRLIDQAEEKGRPEGTFSRDSHDRRLAGLYAVRRELVEMVALKDVEDANQG